jgi:enamine deaminase RidA (YjgF/YER057c/UK114 family)
VPPKFHGDLESQIEQAFSNIDTALKDAGGKGISQVYRITSYHPKSCGDAMPMMKANLLKWFPDHKSMWTAIGAENLGLPEMLVEIEAVAHVPRQSNGHL